MERVLSDTTLAQATYYFGFYVFEALRETGLADRYVERLAPWREMLALGLTSTPENPEPTRSDSSSPAVRDRSALKRQCGWSSMFPAMFYAWVCSWTRMPPIFPG